MVISLVCDPLRVVPRVDARPMRADRRMFVSAEVRKHLQHRRDPQMHRDVDADEHRALHERRPLLLRELLVRRGGGPTRGCFIGIPVHDVVVQNARPVRALDDPIGRAVRQVGGRAGVRRFASCSVPLDEALVEVALDLSGRPFLYYDLDPPGAKILSDPPFDPQLMEEFWRAFVTAAGLTLHGLGITPDSMEAVCPQYLWRFRPMGQFQRKSV